MTTKLTCPDCGGVLGPPEPGYASCSCFKGESYAQAALAQPAIDQVGEEALHDTQHVETLSKTCFKCGADVAGKKRYKDSRGYLCAQCNQAEVAAEKEGTAKCTECGRRVKEAGLTDFRGGRVCKLCMTELRDADKKKVKLISGKNYDVQDRKTLKILIVIMFILMIFMVMSYFKTRS